MAALRTPCNVFVCALTLQQARALKTRTMSDCSRLMV